MPNDERGSQAGEGSAAPSPSQGEHQVRPYARSTAAPLSPPHPFMDWGEAIDVPALYGRERELETLHQWIVEQRCRVVTILGIGGIGKSSLALTAAQRIAAQFDVVLFRSLQNAPPLAELLDLLIRAVSGQQATPPEQLPDKIALLVQLLRTRRCLLILDNFEAILQPGALAGTYRTGYAGYGDLIQALGERGHASCLLLTSREKPTELGLLEGRTAPVRSLPLAGLDGAACQIILESKGIVGAAEELDALAQLYGGNPLALHLVAVALRDLFGGDISAFLATGAAFFNGVGTLMERQCARSTPLERAIMHSLAIARELLPLDALLAAIGESVPQREVLAALESLRRRMQIERSPNRPAFSLQPVILEFITSQLVELGCQEIMEGQPDLLLRRALVQATARDYVRHSQEQLIATPLLEWLVSACGGAAAAEQRLLALLESWRGQPPAEQGYGPGNLINLLRLLRDHLRGLDLAHLAIRQVYLQRVAAQDTSLAHAILQDCVFTETFDRILGMAISDNGAYWAAANERGEMRVWEAGGLRLHRIWQSHTDIVWRVALSPDGQLLASGSWDGWVKLWDVASGALRWSLGQHAGSINGLAFSPDGSTLASCADDTIVQLWAVRDGRLLQILPHPKQLLAIAWSPDGQLLASGDSKGAIHLWQIQAQGPAACVRTFTEHTEAVTGLAFAPDGSVLASASWDATVKLWDTADGSLHATLQHSDRVSRLAWSPDGHTLASGGRDPTIWLWDMAQLRLRTVLPGHSQYVRGLVFTPDGQNLFSGSSDGTLRVWDMASGQCIRSMQGYVDSYNDINWSPDGSKLVSGGLDTVVTIWDAAGTTPPRMLRGHSSSIAGVAWSHANGWLASSQMDNQIRVWDSTSGVCLQILQHPDDSSNMFYSMAWSPDGQRLACGSSQQGVRVFEIAAGRQRWLRQPSASFIRSHVAWSPDGRRLTGGDEHGMVYIWDTADGRLLQQLTGHQGPVLSVAWSPDGALVASNGGSSAVGELLVWDAASGERVQAIVTDGGIVGAVAWGSRANLLVSAGLDGLLRWWDMQRGECVRVSTGHRGSVNALRKSPDGRLLASCAADGALMIWDVETGRLLRTLRHDRPYERMDITGVGGITEAQRITLLALGAVDQSGHRP